MTLERTGAQHQMAVVDKFNNPAADYQMTTRDYTLRPSVHEDPITITLPAISDAIGRMYSIKASGNVAYDAAVTIEDQGDSQDWNGNIVLTIPGEKVVLYSDGLKWMHMSYAGTTPHSQIKISGAWGMTAQMGAILIAADDLGNPLLIGPTTDYVVIERVNVTAAVTGDSNFMANYTTLGTSGLMTNGFIIGHYIRININHLAYENYAIWGRMNIAVAQTSSGALSCNQYIGVFATVNFPAGVNNLLDTGGGYGVYGVASIAIGGTLDQPIIGGYFECNVGSAIAGEASASKHRMLGYVDYGVNVLCQAIGAVAAINIRTQDAATCSDLIRVDANVAGGVTRIDHVFNFLNADESDGVLVAAITITDGGNADGMIKIECAGTDYYIPFYAADGVDNEWADRV